MHASTFAWRQVAQKQRVAHPNDDVLAAGVPVGTGLNCLGRPVRVVSRVSWIEACAINTKVEIGRATSDRARPGRWR